MMQIMHLRQSPKEIKPRMDRRSLHQDQPREYPKGDDVGMDEGEGDGDGENVGEDMFCDRRVLSGESDWCYEFVMGFMNGGVDWRVVKEAMDIVEESFAHEHTKYDMSDDLVDTR